MMIGSVVAVAASPAHTFSKPTQKSIMVIEGHGIEGDAHAGAYVRHRYLAKKQPRLPNRRQVHLLSSELFEELRPVGFELTPGSLGENVTTAGLDLARLPLGTRLRVGRKATIELTGVRTPCVLIDRFRQGLMRHMIADTTPRFKCGVLGIVIVGGEIVAGDPIRAELPSQPWSILPPL